MRVVVWTLAEKRRIAKTRRLVFEGAMRLAEQQRRLARLRAAGRGTANAAHLLDTLGDAQLAMYEHLARQERQSRR